MSAAMKNALGVAIIVAILSLGYAGASAAKSFKASIEPSSYRSFSVSAEGEVTTVPDIAEFSFTVLTEGGTDLGDLQTKNTEAMNKAIQFLKDEGVEAADIKTTGYNVNPRRTSTSCANIYSLDGLSRECPPSKIVGYSVNQNVSVKVRDFDKIGTIMEGIVSRGATGVSGLSFTTDDPTELKNRARENAIEKAQKQAEAVAKAAGVSLGRLLSIEEGGYYEPYYYRAESMGVSMDSDIKSIAPSIEPGSQDTKITVTLRYEIR